VWDTLSVVVGCVDCPRPRPGESSCARGVGAGRRHGRGPNNRRCDGPLVRPGDNRSAAPGPWISSGPAVEVQNVLAGSGPLSRGGSASRSGSQFRTTSIAAAVWQLAHTDSPDETISSRVKDINGVTGGRHGRP
jgi:hypothetical protein